MVAKAGAESGQSRSQKLFWVCPWVVWTQALGPTYTAFPGCISRELDEVEQSGQKLAPIWDANIAGRNLTFYARTTSKVIL